MSYIFPQTWYLLARPQGDAILVAPHVDHSQISHFLGQICEKITKTDSIIENEPLSVLKGEWKPGGTPTENPTRNLLEPALQAKTTEVVKLLGQGVTNKADILLAVWNVRPGRSEKYHQAEEEYKQIMIYLGRLYGAA
jgi:hypothetical protein